MKIFHIVSNKEWGGGEQYVYDLSLRQRADDIDITIFCKPVEDIIQKYTDAGLQVIPLALGGALDLKSAWQMAKIISKAGPCTIHAHNSKMLSQHATPENSRVTRLFASSCAVILLAQERTACSIVGCTANWTS